jgi:myo-inositol 2-dehydrogenase/D-chiro-inositol 1-dehydrogenase
MNFLILGDGAEEREWAAYLANHGEHRLWAMYPGFEEWPDVARPRDLDDALAIVGVEAIVVGGELEFRGEALRRAAAVGLPIICLHPPGADAEAYYQVALSREETGAVIVPDLPMRHHPGVVMLRQVLEGGDLGAFRGLRYEAPADPEGGDLTGRDSARMVDVVRAFVGEIEALTATGDPKGDRPTESLVVQLRGEQSRRAEIRVWSGHREPARLVATGSEGTLTLEYDPDGVGPSRLLRRTAAGVESETDLEPWEPHAATLATLNEARAGREAHPDLLDGTRAMELVEAAVRSLRRERTIELHYGEVSEAGNFKSVMTSVGCLLLLGALVALPVALAGPALGFPATLYIAYAIPPILIVFFIAQALRFAVRKSQEESSGSPAERGNVANRGDQGRGPSQS